MADTKIPIVNLENLYNIPFHVEDEKIQKMTEAFGKALHEYGFAYLTNHGIPDEMVAAFSHLLPQHLKRVKNFFELPQAIKSKYQKVDVLKNYHGYVKMGQELLHKDSVHEMREAYDIHKHDRYYPTEVSNFQGAIESLEKACRQLSMKLMKILAMAVKLEDLDFFMKAASNLEDTSVPSLNTFRTLYYPLIDDKIIPGAVRCSEHTDYGVITLLFQDLIGGLEVRTADNQWIQAEPIPGTIVVNTGDLLESWTGNYFHATGHRVLVPESEVQRKTSRQSMAFFVHPDDDIMVVPLKSEILTEQYEFEPISSYEHAMNKVKKSYGGY